MRTIITILIIIAAIVALFFFGKSRVPDMLANNLSKKLGVPVSIGSMNFDSSEVEINKFTIGNPKEYSLPKAFSAEEIELNAPINTYFSDDILIDEIEVNNIYLGLEFDTITSGDGNWTTIFKHFQENSKVDEKGGKKVTIKRLVFNNIQTELLFRSEGGNPKRLPEIKQIVLKNVSTEGGSLTDQLMGTVLAQMVKQVFIEQNLNNMIKGFLLDTPGNAVDKFLEPFKGFFNTAPKEHADNRV
ncbi:MAG: hypothetical protein P0S96_02970 [Simkaniaceae bacterium]|nr:hypothetical protein [Candidatus Sacchlamyda saccharinae]